MARKRMIDPGIWTSEQVNNLSRDARLLFIGLFSNADDKGRLKGSTRYLKAIIFPYDNLDVDEIKSWLDEIISQQLVIQYNVNGDDYITLPNFLKHQTINRPSESKLPAPKFNETSVSIHGELSEGSSLKEGKGGEGKRREKKLIPPKGGQRKAPSTKESDINYVFSEMRKYLGYPEDFRGEANSSAAEVSAEEAKKVIDPIPNYGKEGKAIKRMLIRGFTREEILACWKGQVS